MAGRPAEQEVTGKLNIFVLNAGRCGSNTFAMACSHALGLTVGHESRVEEFGDARFAYEPDHIEVDNRLSWFLGGLDARFPDARYVHLRRDREATAQSYARRWPSHNGSSDGEFVPDRTIIRQFAHTVVFRERSYTPEEIAEVARFYVDTVNANISQFLQRRPHVVVELDQVTKDFPAFWEWAGLDGDLDAAMAEWQMRYNEADGPAHALVAPALAPARHADGDTGRSGR